jgi:N-acetyl-gamma-glutamyl-phosphate reductase
MLTTVYATPVAALKPEDIVHCYTSVYAKHPFIRLCAKERVPDTMHVKGTNFCDIGFKLDGHTNRLILISAIDNLVKGAAGQAVQNMNIMLGLDETAGLDPIPYPL